VFVAFATKELSMRRYVLRCAAVAFFILALTPSTRADVPAKAAVETWDAAYLEGAKCGSFRTVTTTLERDGQKLVRTTLTMDLRIRRYNAVVPLRIETGDDETADGKVIGLSMTQFADKGSLTQTGTVDGTELIVGIKGQADTRRVPWDATVLGMHKQESVFRDRKVKPGDKFDYRTFELSLLMPVTVRVAVKDFEDVDLLVAREVNGKSAALRQKKKLLRVESVPDKVEVGGNAVQLPRLVSWLDDKRDVVRSEMELPGLGKIALYRTTKAIATEEGVAPALMPDLGLNTLIPLNRAIARPLDDASIVYRVTVKGDDDPSTTFVRDARQQVSDASGAAFTLTVQRQQIPVENAEAEAPKAEFGQSSYFIDSDDPKVRELAAAAVAREADALRRAQRIERWVYDHMTGTSDVGFVPSSQIARDLKGDCRQHAMLTAAMCRAVGVPSRTAVGLVYVNDSDRGPVFGFHMWTEVWARGKWLGVDATLGRGTIGPGHLKVADASWHNTQTLAPLLPVIRVMGRLGIEVVKVEER
jgi:hypothetical protein